MSDIFRPLTTGIIKHKYLYEILLCVTYIFHVEDLFLLLHSFLKEEVRDKTSCLLTIHVKEMQNLKMHKKASVLVSNYTNYTIS